MYIYILYILYTVSVHYAARATFVRAHHTTDNMAHTFVHAVPQTDGRVLFYTDDPASGGVLVVSLTGGMYKDQNGKVYEAAGKVGWFLKIQDGMMRGFEKAKGMRAESLIWENGKVEGKVLEAKKNGMLFTGKVDEEGNEFGYLLRRSGQGFKIVGGPGRTYEGIMDKTIGMKMEGSREIKGKIRVKGRIITFKTKGGCEIIDSGTAGALRANFLRSLDGSVYNIMMQVYTTPLEETKQEAAEIKITRGECGNGADRR